MRRALLFSSVLCAALAASSARAAGEIAAAPSASSSPATALPDLPKLQPIANPEPDPGALKDLDRTLDRLTSNDAGMREDAKKTIGDATPGEVAAIRRRVQDLRASLDRDAAPKLLEDIRKVGRKALKKEKGGDEPEKKKKKHADEDEADGDWLDFALEQAKPSDKNWQQLVKLLAMERMLTAIGTTPAVRELIQLHAYFGELLRIDLQRQIAKLKDKAVPALIEARQHDAKIVQKWANKELDALGKAIPGEAVGTNDTQILADVLRAYGRTRDVDAARVVLTFANSDRVQLRDAAREAIAAIGEPAVWQLRDQYLGMTGNKPPKDWSWDRIARELFGLYDHARLAELFKLMEDGTAAAASKKWSEAVDDFDKVLARSPLFERRKEMLKAYEERARELENDKRGAAMEMFEKALRLDPKSQDANSIESEVSYLEGLDSIDRGAPDRFLFDRAVELDPTNERAKAARASLEEKAAERQSNMKRYAAAIGVALAALVAMILLLRRKPREAAAAAPTIDEKKAS